jgi:hypothetical protein
MPERSRQHESSDAEATRITVYDVEEIRIDSAAARSARDAHVAVSRSPRADANARHRTDEDAES